MIRTMGIKNLKASFSENLAQVKAGDEIVVTERGIPIAKLVPVLSPEESMEDMARRGVVRPPTRTMDPEEFLRLPRPDDPEGLVRAALIGDRRDGR